MSMFKENYSIEPSEIQLGDADDNWEIVRETIEDLGDAEYDVLAVVQTETMAKGLLSMLEAGSVDRSYIKFDVIWQALQCYREDCASEDDEGWDEICTQMAHIAEALGIDNVQAA